MNECTGCIYCLLEKKNDLFMTETCVHHQCSDMIFVDSKCLRRVNWFIIVIYVVIVRTFGQNIIFFFGLSPLPLYVYYIQCTQINCIFSYCYFEENTKKMIRKLIVYCLSTLGYFHPAFLYIYFLFNPWFVSYLFPILNAEQKQLTC